MTTVSQQIADRNTLTLSLMRDAVERCGSVEAFGCYMCNFVLPTLLGGMLALPAPRISD